MTLASISLTLHLGLNAFVSLFYPVFKINFMSLFVQGPIPEMQMLNINFSSSYIHILFKSSCLSETDISEVYLSMKHFCKFSMSNDN